MSSSTVSLVRLHSMHLGRSVGGGTRLATRSSISSPLRTSLFTPASTSAASSRIRIASSTASKARAFSSSSATSFTHTATNNNKNKMAPSTQTLIEVAKARRSYYVLGRNSPVPDSEILELVNQAILHIPSSFNTQSTRLVVALHGDHEKVWDIAADSFKSLIASGAVTQETFDTQTKPKLDLFKGAYGTILFYEDPAHVKPYAEKFPAFGDKFPQWADHSNAMHQWFLWAGLESLGFGANLQHYNPLIDAALAKTFDIPSDWDLKAQLVFGSIEAPANEKQFKPTEERVKVFGAQL